LRSGINKDSVMKPLPSPDSGSRADSDIEEDRAFREQCRRQMARSLESRMKYGFCRVYRPILDDADVRVFDTTKAYREWCAANLPAYLGFQPAGGDK
jgi:hypothetical protein